MKARLLRRLLAVVVLIGATIGIYYYAHASLLRIRLKNGTEIRVLKVAYGNNAHHEHELVHLSDLKRRLIHLLPQQWQGHFISLPDPQNRRFNSYFQYHSEPVISVWWAYAAQVSDNSQKPASKTYIHFANRRGPPQLDHPAYMGEEVSASLSKYVLMYPLAPNEPDLLVFSRPPGPAKTLTVNFEIKGEPVTFTVPIPPLSK